MRFKKSFQTKQAKTKYFINNVSESVDMIYRKCLSNRKKHEYLQ